MPVPHSISAPGQTHLPAWQVVFAPHALPQVPQLERSAIRSTHFAFGPVPQSIWLPVQLHWPPLQT
jgi:hypothetical protein